MRAKPFTNRSNKRRESTRPLSNSRVEPRMREGGVTHLRLGAIYWDINFRTRLETECRSSSMPTAAESKQRVRARRNSDGVNGASNKPHTGRESTTWNLQQRTRHQRSTIEPTESHLVNPETGMGLRGTGSAEGQPTRALKRPPRGLTTVTGAMQVGSVP